MLNILSCKAECCAVASQPVWPSGKCKFTSSKYIKLMFLCPNETRLQSVACFDEDNKTFCVMLIRKLAAFYQIEIYIFHMYREIPLGHMILIHTHTCSCVNSHYSIRSGLRWLQHQRDLRSLKLWFCHLQNTHEEHQGSEILDPSVRTKTDTFCVPEQKVSQVWGDIRDKYVLFLRELLTVALSIVVTFSQGWHKKMFFCSHLTPIGICCTLLNAHLHDI